MVKSLHTVHRAPWTGAHPAAPGPSTAGERQPSAADDGGVAGDTATISESAVRMPPVDGPAVDQRPVDQGPVDQGPVDQGPVDQPPADRPPGDQSAVDRPPVDRPPVDQRPRRSPDGPPAPAFDEPPQRPTAELPPIDVAGPSPAATFTPDGIERLTRRRDGSILGGVAGGIADHLKVPVLWVRVTFALLAIMGGAGILAYALLWIFVPQRRGHASQDSRSTTPVERRQAYGVAALGAALMIAAMALGFGEILTWVLGPLGLAAIGAAFIWREADDARRARWRRTAAGIVGPSTGSWWRLIGGCLLVVGGLSVFAVGQLDFTAVRSALIAVVLTLVGVAIITIPWWLRLVRDLGDERRGRIQERERAEIAAHLHDSVLQTLALIQRQAGDSREVQRLARSQERQLRTWLYGPAGYASAGDAPAAASSSLAVSLAEAAGEVEDTYAVAVTPVIVGDVPMDQHVAALVAASREAMVNAAKHAAVEEISVYAEVEDGTVSVYVRDRGVGFDPATVGTDRRGLAESIRGRMERHGGTATVRSRPGEGTEIELSVPVTAVADTGGGPDPASTARDQGTGAASGAATDEHLWAPAAGTVGATADTKGPQ